MDNYNQSEISKRIYIARKNKGIKQIEACQLLRIGQSTYSRIESGRYDFSISLLYKLSNIYDVSVSWLLGFDDNSSFTPEELLEIDKFKSYILNRK